MFKSLLKVVFWIYIGCFWILPLCGNILKAFDGGFVEEIIPIICNGAVVLLALFIYRKFTKKSKSYKEKHNINGRDISYSDEDEDDTQTTTNQPTTSQTTVADSNIDPSKGVF